MSEKRKILAALDVGGTKADAVLFDQTGKVLRHVVGKGSVPVEIGVDATNENLLGVMNQLTGDFDGDVDAFYASIATMDFYGTQLPDHLRSNLPYKKMRFEEDGPCMISGVLGHRDGASLICGTGSALYVRNGEKYYTPCTGGYLLDSCGSGYVLGKLALKAGFLSKIGREEPTVLTELLEKQCGEPLRQHYSQIYAKGRAYIASFARTVFEARNMGDRVAIRIFNLCASELADMVWIGYRDNGCKPFDIVFNGGIFFNYPEYVQAVKAMAPKDVHVFVSDTKPIYGCAVEAMYDIGLECDDAFKENFLRTYAQI